MKLCRRVGPPSTIREVMPYSSYSLCIFLSRLSFGSSIIAFFNAFNGAPLLSTPAAMRGEANITGRGLRPGQSLVVSDGLSASNVPVPTIMASVIARSRCMSVIVRGVEIIRRSSGAASAGTFISPSAVCAHFN